MVAGVGSTARKNRFDFVDIGRGRIRQPSQCCRDCAPHARILLDSGAGHAAGPWPSATPLAPRPSWPTALAASMRTSACGSASKRVTSGISSARSSRPMRADCLPTRIGIAVGQTLPERRHSASVCARASSASNIRSRRVTAAADGERGQSSRAESRRRHRQAGVRTHAPDRLPPFRRKFEHLRRQVAGIGNAHLSDGARFRRRRRRAWASRSPYTTAASADRRARRSRPAEPHRSARRRFRTAAARLRSRLPT